MPLVSALGDIGISVSLAASLGCRVSEALSFKDRIVSLSQRDYGQCRPEELPLTAKLFSIWADQEGLLQVT